jgi:hypothetical protein
VRTIVSCLLLSIAFFVQAQARDFPPLSKPGTLRGFERPFVKIGSKTYRLAPAARIFDQENRLIQPVVLDSGLKIVYKLEAQTGYVHVIWLLAPGEAVRIQQ